MDRCVCIHGHFYQPPRENPWLETIEMQDSAYPFHDWNERITAECYAPNAASRILDREGLIEQIVNNYSKISFNFGPTLLAWMAAKAPAILSAVQEADRESQRRFSGHGSAMAQVYNHMIMPLANSRDKETQVLWGLRDFEHRFGRRPEGMWLSETAVDLETLEVLAQHGILFTVLAPSQAKRVRKSGARAWQNVDGSRIDPTRAYELRLRSGRTIALFFYDGPASRDVAFEQLLTSGERFADRLIGLYSDTRDWPQIVHIATDGETYGHHHRHGDMALAYALHHIEQNNLARLTNYGEFLEQHPPTHQVEIHENSSWSCVHGVERWRTDCGCNSGMHRGWNQAWRAPLREALDLLRDAVATEYRNRATEFLRDPWAARNDYIGVLLDRAPSSVEDFLRRHAIRDLEESEKVTVLKLLELQRHAMLMYTSCGWFFDEISGIETVQVLQYAGRALQLADELFESIPEARFLEILEKAKSNVPEHQDGRRIYEKFVKPAMVNLPKVVAHCALSRLFDGSTDEASLFCYDITVEEDKVFKSGRAQLAVGHVRITSEITLESAALTYGALYIGEHNPLSGVREFEGDEAYQAMVQELKEAFGRGDFAEVIRRLDRHLGGAHYTLRSLFRDERRRVVNLILASTLADAESDFRQVCERNVPLMTFLADLGAPIPKALRAAAEITLNADLGRALEAEDVILEEIREVLENAKAWKLELDAAGLGYRLEQQINVLADRLREVPADLTALSRINSLVDLARLIPFEAKAWRWQNVVYDVLHSDFAQMKDRADGGDSQAQAWISQFQTLAAHLSIRIPR